LLIVAAAVHEKATLITHISYGARHVDNRPHE